MRIEQLRQLIVVVETGNFSRASRTLGISQSALTRSIQSLEEYYGGSLLDRLPRGVVPTTYGNAVVAWAIKTLASSENLKRYVELLQNPGMGTIVVGSGPYFSDFILGETISELHRKHSQLKIKVRIDIWENLENLLLSQKIDLFVGYVDEIKNPKEVSVIELIKEPIIFFARSGHPLLQKKSLELVDILEYPLVGPTVPPAMAAKINDTLKAESESNSFLAIEFDNYAGVRKIVETTDCVGGLPESSVAALIKTKKLSKLPVALEGVYTSAGMAYLKDRILLPAVELFMQEISKKCKQDH